MSYFLPLFIPIGGTDELTVYFSDLPDYVIGGNITFEFDIINHVSGTFDLALSNLPKVYITDQMPQEPMVHPFEEILDWATHFAEGQAGKEDVMLWLTYGFFSNRHPSLYWYPLAYDPDESHFISERVDGEVTMYFNYWEWFETCYYYGTDRAIDCKEVSVLRYYMSSALGHFSNGLKRMYTPARPQTPVSERFYAPDLTTQCEKVRTFPVRPMGYPYYFSQRYDFGYHQVFVDDNFAEDPCFAHRYKLNGFDHGTSPASWSPATGNPWYFSLMNGMEYWQTVLGIEVFGLIENYKTSLPGDIAVIPKLAFTMSLEGIE